MFFSQPIFYFLLGVLLIFLLDSIGAILSNRYEFKYRWFIPLSLGIYVLIGFLLGNQSNYTSTIFYTSLLGLFDATIGLRVAIFFKGYWDLSKEQIDSMKNIKTSIFMIVVGWLFGSLGFLVS